MRTKLPPFNFLGLEGQSFEKAAAIVIPVPYDGTTKWTTWGAGARKGPAAVINASRNLETFDEELETDPSAKGIFTLGPLAPKKKPEDVVKQVEAVVEKILGEKKFPLALGGEHSVTLGSARAAKKFFPRLTVLQFDAHADLRNEFEGTRFSHACVARRILDEGIRLVQVGVRSVCEEDWSVMKKNPGIKTFFAKDEWSADDIAAACGPSVFVTFDLDALDPSIMPSTSTPEPGGLAWKEALSVLKLVGGEKTIVGADVVELSPVKNFFAPDFLAAKLAYKIIGYALTEQK